MKAKISQLAARTMIEGWYAQECENNIAADCAAAHFNPTGGVGDFFDLDCGSWLVCEPDGWYVTNVNSFD